MEYLAVYRTKADRKRNFEIGYRVFKEENSYGIESFICGGSFYEKAVIGNCCEEKAEKIVMFFAEKGVHPLHIENIILDMRF